MGRLLDRLAAALGDPLDARELDLTGNEDDRLEAVPVGLGKLKNLEILRLDHNALETLPAEIGKLTKLRELHAAHNRITSEGIARSVWFLKYLEVLDLHGNALSWVDNLGNYQKGEMALYLGGNPLDVARYTLVGRPVHPLWSHVLHMFPLTRYGKFQLRTLALDLDRIAFPLPGEQTHHSPPFPNLHVLQLYGGEPSAAQRAELAAYFPNARIETYPRGSEGPHPTQAPGLAERLPPGPPLGAPAAWHPEQSAHLEKLRVGVKKKKGLVIDESELRPGVDLVTRPPKKKDLLIGASRIGGTPDLPTGVEWPANAKGEAMVFVAQLRMEDFVPYDPTGLLPSRGLLSFFASSHDEGRVLYHEDTSGLAPREWPEPAYFSGLEQEAPFPVAATALHGTLSGPDDAAAWILEKAGPKKALHRVLGWSYGDTEEFDDGLVLLFAAGTDPLVDMSWGDAGRLYFTLRHEHLARRDFSRVEVMATM